MKTVKLFASSLIGLLVIQGALAQNVSSLNTQVQGSAGSDQPSLKLQVIDPYADVHSGPGRGYPVFYAVEEGEAIRILAQRPGWYEIRLQNGRTGWVTAAQISRTIQDTGEPADLPTVSYGDYLKNSFRVGFTSGAYTSGELEGADVWSATGGYRANGWLELEGEYGKVYGDDIRGDFYGVNALIEPFSQWQFSPYLVLGVGTMDIDSQPKLIPLEIGKSDFKNYGIGGNYYLGRNFLVKIEYRSHTVSTDDSDVELGAWKIGFNTFF
ncbi:SH3 domain-containing protein [Teredinibacter haidensis]|uniref:SH3 domain-containing protein n=1 Tax=Teredinibacter haidensis TaxID=2731755 RepID=UPI000948B252|nr:SH3 domain-containing protein [Teredinibacter haidensis]